MVKPKIIPAIIAKNQKEFDDAFSKVSEVSKILHLDVMDGEFVKNESLNFDLEIPKGFRYEAHLMIKDPFDFVKNNLNKSEIVLVHVESENSDELNKIIKFVKSRRKEIGLVLNPKTSLEKAKPFLNKIDRVLLMSVEPGKYGSKFEPSVLRKISALRDYLKENKIKLDIQVDGAVNDKTILRLKKSGANIFVVGSYFMNSRNVEKDYSELIRKV